MLPKNFWKNNQNLAFNETMKESVSLGFIRVKRESKIAELRGEIQAQCVPTEVPREYIFLKSVGRALTRVRAKQEQELKVKNFIPPQVGPYSRRQITHIMSLLLLTLEILF